MKKREKSRKDKRGNKRKIQAILNEQLSLIKPSQKEYANLIEKTQNIKEKIEKSIKKLKVRAEVFVGGSLAKGTIIKKDRYDIDIFMRFQPQKKQKYQKGDISKILNKILKSAKLKIQIIHGSRDYFSVREKSKYKDVFFEIVPVLKIKNPKQAENIMDLSFFHVSYITREIKKEKRKKLADEIRLAKAFCYSQNCYGAESYIKGFSGYALELLICYYKSFLNFIKAIAEAKSKTNKPSEKIIIDKQRAYKNKQDILINLNEAKLQSPIVFVDPTFRERNALAALSQETFDKFKKACIEFLKAPSRRFFEKQEINLKQLQKQAKRKNANLIILTANTTKQPGDIAGSKLLKFFNFLVEKIEKYFEISRKEFVYKQGKDAKFYLIIKKKKHLIVQGPPINKIDNLKKFKEKHKNCFIKQHRVYAKEKSLDFGKFFTQLKEQNKQNIKEMSISKIY